jgi:hypothetical protein
MASGARDVFVNCAFDREFRPLFYAIVFAITCSGFKARCALEVDDGSENRLAKIIRIIGECRFGIHDISRTEPSGTVLLPRFNMPLELGIFLGAKQYGAAEQKKKRVLVLDTQAYRYQQFISDIAGQDIHAHAGDAGVAIEAVAAWLRDQSGSLTVPGGRKMAEEFRKFLEELPDILSSRSLHADELTFRDFTSIATIYVDVQHR